MKLDFLSFKAFSSKKIKIKEEQSGVVGGLGNL